MRMPRFLFQDDAQNDSWLEIIVEAILCVICPFLIIPYLIFKSKYKGNLQDTICNIYIIAISIILILSPIVTILWVVSYGFFKSFEEIGLLFAIDFAEIHFALSLIWNLKIKKKIKKKIQRIMKIENYEPDIEQDVFNFNEHPFIMAAYGLGYSALCFVFMFNGIIYSFFGGIILIYGFSFFVKRLR